MSSAISCPRTLRGHLGRAAIFGGGYAMPDDDGVEFPTLDDFKY